MHVTVLPFLPRLRAWAGRLRRSTSGIAMTEFALAAPALMMLGTYGLETANLAITQLRLSQISSNLADTVSRVGVNIPEGMKQLRETDIDDSFEMIRYVSDPTRTNMPITTYGRVILSSLEQNANNGQWIRWQRCLGLKHVSSSYGVVTSTGDTDTTFPGMGEAGKEIKAPKGYAVIFAEIIYDYQPLISNKLLGARTLKAKAAFLVRDNRDLSAGNDPQNPTPKAPVLDCAQYTL